MIEALLNSLWQGAFVVAIAAGVSAFVPKRHAATRYSIWFVALVAIALLPICGQVSFGQTASAIPSSVIRPTAVASHVTKQAASDLGGLLTVIWIAGIVVCLGRLALSHFRIAALVRCSVRAPHLGADVLISPSIAVPIAAGFRCPVVIIPSKIVDALDPSDLECIVAHEHAHIRRNDIAGNLIQRLLQSVLFFNPWAYIIGYQLVKEREAACDDWAVLTAPDLERYASCLASLALGNRRASTPLLTPSAIGSGRILVDRIARLLNGKASQLKTNYGVVAIAVTLFAVVGFASQNATSLAATKCSSYVSVVSPARPDIPESIAKAHPHAEVTLTVTVTAAGIPSSIDMVKSSGVMAIDIAAAHAARDSKYTPEMRNCKAVSGGKYMFHIEV
jgi:TonB family protein